MSTPSPTKDQILDCLRSVQDPDLHSDIVSLDFVKNIAVCDGHARIEVELTTPACPMKNRIRTDIEQAVGQLGIEQVEVVFTARVRKAALSQAELPGVKNVIAIGAGKGGVGKSTLSVLTAVGLARAGARVGLLDADIYGPSIPKMLGIEDEKPQLGPDGDKMIPVEVAGLKVISIGLIIPRDQAVIWRGPMIHGTVKQFLEQVDWGELDYLIVDLPPGTGDVPLTLSQSVAATGAIIVCTPQDVALMDAVRAARMYQQLKVDVLGFVENMSYFIAPDTGKEYDLFGKGGVERAAAELGVPMLGAIPINVSIRICGDAGTPDQVFEANPQGVAEAVTRVVENIAAQVSIHNAQTEATA